MKTLIIILLIIGMFHVEIKDRNGHCFKASMGFITNIIILILILVGKVVIL